MLYGITWPQCLVFSCGGEMNHAIAHDTLRSLASKYIWWKSPDEAVATPARVISQVMDIGDFTDMQQLASEVGEEVLREVLTHAEAGQFSGRSWAYWHYRLGLAETEEEIPALPLRRIV